MFTVPEEGGIIVTIGGEPGLLGSKNTFDVFWTVSVPPMVVPPTVPLKGSVALNEFALEAFPKVTVALEIGSPRDRWGWH